MANDATGIIAINRLRLQHLVRRQVPGAQTIRHFLAHPARLLGTTLIATNLLHVVTSVLAAAIVHRLYRPLGPAAAFDPDAYLDEMAPHGITYGTT